MGDVLIMVPVRGMLVRQREKLGMSQEEVAAKADIKLEQYKRYENPDHAFSFSSSSLRIVNAVLTALELGPTAFAKGEYSLEKPSDDDPLHETLRALDAKNEKQGG
jgi:transcriptional regulator with XRE-family HTH domain